MEFNTVTMTYTSEKDFAFVEQNIVDKEVCRFVAQEMRLLDDMISYANPALGKEPGQEESFSWYGPLCLETLSLHVQPKLEKILGRTLIPSYTYGRIYRFNGRLDKHLDRRSSEYTVSVCIEKDSTHDWELCVQRPNKDVNTFKLDVGDMLIYPGRDLVHWREGGFRGKEQIQAFLQYVDANGDSTDLKWDGRPRMGLEFGSTQKQDHNLDREQDLQSKIS